jgi:hypothetical protein
MASEGPIDLISLEGEGNKVVVRITGRQSGPATAPADALVGEVLVDTGFVRGSMAVTIFPEDLTEWRDALDSLDGGQDVAWREGERAPELFIELDPDGKRADVTLADRSMSLTTVTATVVITDDWFDEAYQRLDQVLRAWPLGGA